MRFHVENGILPLDFVPSRLTLEASPSFHECQDRISQRMDHWLSHCLPTSYGTYLSEHRGNFSDQPSWRQMTSNHPLYPSRLRNQSLHTLPLSPQKRFLMTRMTSSTAPTTTATLQMAFMPQRQEKKCSLTFPPCKDNT